LVPPEIYLLQVLEYKEQPGKKDPQSTTAEIRLKVLCNKDGNETYKGAQSMLWINEKGLEIHPNPNFLLALGAKVDPQTGIDANLDAGIKGKLVEAFVVRGNYNNRDNNSCADFFPPGTNIKKEIVENYVN
jgi:hypothetical protein